MRQDSLHSTACSTIWFIAAFSCAVTEIEFYAKLPLCFQFVIL